MEGRRHSFKRPHCLYNKHRLVSFLESSGGSSEYLD